ncbi:hypothetical protein BAUCODRAFT_273361 [Baudoinia panamericana UAMH 10762]|uniref:Uncharacterized protein n=1 Tax=Baudoinia panamericana (strain UAMH 10762) TaxID=717646 RepID=M2MNR4_BAUPA|nr:uncharacterized protein BAUCODRAFT_273361 [Baudoinia panamericana UAMH 10762]EMC93088.1 hypothetical protein BAUCODRAFT_273361 [Baudoinia panamericana UAMH 10762]
MNPNERSSITNPGPESGPTPIPEDLSAVLTRVNNYNNQMWNVQIPAQQKYHAAFLLLREAQTIQQPDRPPLLSSCIVAAKQALEALRERRQREQQVNQQQQQHLREDQGQQQGQQQQQQAGLIPEVALRSPQPHTDHIPHGLPLPPGLAPSTGKLCRDAAVEGFAVEPQQHGSVDSSDSSDNLQQHSYDPAVRG